jgi:ABC-2 type transport system permease protein
MKAVYKKEVRSYLTSMIGYVFIFFILLVYGIYFTYVNIDNAYPEVGITLQYVLFVMLIAVPVLTMRVIAEERRQKTDQLLLTSPLKIEHMILGKYLALECIFLIPVAVIAVGPLIMTRFGDISLPMAYTAILGFLLLGSAQIAVGVFASSLTENQIIAAVVCFILLFLSNVIEGISGFLSRTALASYVVILVMILALCMWLYSLIRNAVVTVIAAVAAEGIVTVVYLVKSAVFEGAVQNFLSIFDLTGHLDAFTNGILDINGMIYYLSVIFICLFLSVQLVKKRRWN